MYINLHNPCMYSGHGHIHLMCYVQLTCILYGNKVYCIAQKRVQVIQVGVNYKVARFYKPLLMVYFCHTLPFDFFEFEANKAFEKRFSILI